MRRKPFKATKMSSCNGSRDFHTLAQPRREVICFICDEIIVGKGIPLLMTYTTYSNTDLPTKIGQLVGDRFMVIVAMTDVLCKRCLSLINQLDKLENDSNKVRTMLTEFLKVKYQLTDEMGLEYDNIYEKDSEIQNLSLEDNHCISSKGNFIEDQCFGAKVVVEEQTVDDVKYNFVFQDIKTENLKKEDSASITDVKIVNMVVPETNKCTQGNWLSLCSQEQIETGGSDDLYVSKESVDNPATAITIYECNSCSFTSPVLDSLMNHLKNHSENKHSKCSVCCQTFESQLSIQHHVRNVHGASNLQFSEEIRELENDPDYHPTHQKIYECGVCKYHHNNKKVLESHMRKHSLMEKYTCRICCKSFKLRMSLKKHMLSHELLKCSDCPAVFRNKISLANHCKLHSYNSKIYELNDSKQSTSMIDETEVSNRELIEDEINKEENKRKSESTKFDKVQDLSVKVHSTEAERETSGERNKVSESFSNQKEENFFRTIEKDKENSESSISVEKHSVNIITKDRVKDLHIKEFVETTGSYLVESQETCSGFENNKNSPASNCEILAVLDSDCTLDNCEIINSEKSMQIVCDATNKEEEDEIIELTTGAVYGSKGVSKKMYVCSLCGLRTSSESHIKRHFKCHIALERKTFKCHVCERVLTTRSNLKRHIALHENCSSGEMECNMCNEMLTDRLHLKHHMEVNHPESYQCSFCDRRFDSKRACREHESTHPSFQCDVCQKMFLAEGRLKSHRILMHSDPRQTIITRSKVFKCHICHKILTTYHNLKRHLRNHEKCSGAVSCVLCNEELTDKLHLRQHVEERHPENHQCSFCHKVFGNRKTCKAHEMTHPERFVYKCESCDKLFLTEARMKRHQDIMHRDPHCRICSKEIANPLKLLDHERRHERHKVMFPCDQCPKVFRTPSGLKYHMSVHTGKYAVYCEICGKGLHSEVVLEEHKATHTKEVRYTCEKCGRTFSSNSTYRMHRLWHDNPFPYKCNICDRKFKHTSILAVHKRRAHTGERPYKCPHCTQTFSVSSTLNKHIILHTKDYPYRCKLCEKGFTTRTKIARHMAKVHNDFEMLNSKKKACEYKMVLHPSEISGTHHDSNEDPLVSVDEILRDEKVGEEEDTEIHTATLEELEQVEVDPAQAAIFTIFQQDLPSSQFSLNEFDSEPK